MSPSLLVHVRDRNLSILQLQRNVQPCLLQPYVVLGSGAAEIVPLLFLSSKSDFLHVCEDLRVRFVRVTRTAEYLFPATSG